MAIFCGVTDAAMEANDFGQWPLGHTLTWAVVPPYVQGFTHDELRDIYNEQWKKWDDVSGIKIVWTADVTRANVLCGAREIANPRILAEAQLPWPGINPASQLRMWMNLRAQFVAAQNPPAGMADIGRVHLHEGGHNLGLNHDSDENVPNAIMDATISQLRDLTPRNIQQIQIRYGVEKPVPLPPPPAPGDDMGEFIRAVMDCLNALTPKDRETIMSVIRGLR